jgi:hypothetical protein
MARELKNLGIVNPNANVETLAFAQGTAGLFLVSVIATNTSIEDARFDVTVFNASASTNNAFIAKSQLLPGRNSYETQRFTLDYNDAIYIKSTSSSVSFLVSGINQTE